jgi:hypothetical protein
MQMIDPLLLQAMATAEGTVSPAIPNEAIVLRLVNVRLEQREVASAVDLVPFERNGFYTRALSVSTQETRLWGLGEEARPLFTLHKAHFPQFQRSADFSSLSIRPISLNSSALLTAMKDPKVALRTGRAIAFLQNISLSLFRRKEEFPSMSSSLLQSECETSVISFLELQVVA